MGFFQPHVAANPAGVSLVGKTAIVTGASSGLGLATAQQLLDIGVSTLVLAVRNISKGEQVKHDLLATTSATSASDVRVMQIDMADPKSVLAFANQVRTAFATLDILILNAGLGMEPTFNTSAAGHELIMQINYHSNVLLILELLPLLESGSNASRITWIGSRMMHFRSPLRTAKPAEPLAWLDQAVNCKKFFRYQESKLVAAMFLYEFAARLDPLKVQINMMCPGMVITNLEAHGTPFIVRVLVGVVKRIRGRTTADGAALIMHSAVYAGPETHGKFLGDATVEPLDDFIASNDGQKMQQTVWTESLGDALKHISEERRSDVSQLLSK
ncbi:hypothetical protein BKA62DRAFT_748226 [Auriculariales sp. MPI-PUGE-AT-0066]|nr:hypothetical protein BKA62DRAFT_748226 [Auriculariales sp. MPI-PUGE-AT-0066]